ncbi:hypothetical protein PVL29_012112 [Vitis rotundifolia]|uniref:Reverse transcriptase Ty1/copia-type domain-containing protein n=1 Tax=Vitis rotundifolia TaxID=103349 RepID=A0AA38ZQC5_VITRO|nr:hypothetical protein PVL29_012112 [Vitis rotundifolia]
MEQPPRFVDPLYPTHVCKLDKSLYGLKQSPRAWYTKLSTYLLHLGFVTSKNDSSLIICHSSHGLLLVLVYVDDIIVTGSHSTQVTHLIQQLHHQFSLKDLGSLHYFLGLEVHRTPTGIHLSQAKYITDLLTRAAMLDAKPCPTPMSSNTNLSLHDGVALENGSDYRSFVGALSIVP